MFHSYDPSWQPSAGAKCFPQGLGDSQHKLG
jgi:hypothetical protein